MKARKKTIIIITAFALLPLILAAVLCAFAFGPSQYGNTFLGEMKYKRQRLADAEGKRIIVIGGSSVAFGQDSALMERFLPEYSVVDFGLYGDLGTKLMLDLAEGGIREGDMVIVAPEQSEQTLSLFFSGAMFWQAADGDFSMFRGVKRENIGSVIGSMPEFAAAKAGYAMTSAPTPDDIYRRQSFNEHGDIKRGLREYNIMSEGYDGTRGVSFDSSVISEDFIDYLNAFAKKAEDRGASVYYRMCPINRSALVGEATAADFFEFLEGKLDFELMGNPENSVIDAEYFYDSNFHLNDSGVLLNTRNLVRDIKATLGDSSPTHIFVPPAPAPPTEDDTGDNGDEGMFAYELVDGAYVIVGLTEEGAARTSLTVPVKHDGVKVSGFTAAAFAGNETLVELVLQSNIGMIEDRSFAGCTAFRRLVLLHDKPSRCIVGDDLFGGARFAVFVPRELVSKYKVSYFWTKYANRIFAEDGAK